MSQAEFTGLVPLLQVHDLPVSLAFYCDGLGFDVLDASDPVEDGGRSYVHWCWLRAGGADLMLNTRYDTGEQPPLRDLARASAHGDIALYLSHPDLDDLRARLNARGIEAGPVTKTAYGARELSLTDPDDFILAIHKNWPAACKGFPKQRG